MNYEISVKAREDLESIWVFTMMTWSTEQADRYLSLIRNEIEHLTKFPFSGKDFGSIRKGYRASQVKSHFVFYKIRKNKTLEIVRVLHESMDFLDWLEE